MPGIAEGELAGLRALVLGGTGLIGSHAVESLLARGCAVRVVSRAPEKPRAFRDGSVEWARGRLEDLDTIRFALDDVDLLVHAAAPYPTRHFGMHRLVAGAVEDFRRLLALCRSLTPPELLKLAIPRAEQIAIEQAEMAGHVARMEPARAAELASEVRQPSLLPLAREHRLDASRHPPLEECRALPGLKRVIYVSSVTTIGRPRGREGDEPERRPARESDRYDLLPDPSPYFACKRLLEAEATRACNEGLPAVIVNPTLVVDRMDAHLTTGRILLPVARGRMPVALRGRIDVVAASDVGEGIARAALRGRTGQRYILGHEWMCLRDFLAMVAEEAGVAPPRAILPPGLVEPLAWLSELLAWAGGSRWPVFPMHGLEMLRRSQPVDTSLAVEELGLPQTPVRDAVRRALDWYRAEGLLPRRT